MVNILKRCKEKLWGKFTLLAATRIEKPSQEENKAREERIPKVRTLGLWSQLCHNVLQHPPPPRAPASSQRERLGFRPRFLQLPCLVICVLHDPGPVSSHTKQGPLGTGHGHCPGAWVTQSADPGWKAQQHPEQEPRDTSVLQSRRCPPTVTMRRD